MEQLWRRIERHRPIVLTGVPKEVEEAADNKRAWVARHLGDHVEVRCCRFAGEVPARGAGRRPDR